MANQQAGWYADPSGDVTKLRYWNGTEWTNDFTDAPPHVQPAAQDAESAATPDKPQVEAAAMTPAETQQSVPPAFQPAFSETDKQQQYAQNQQPIPIQPEQPFVPVESQQPSIEPLSTEPFAPAEPQQPYAPAEPQQPYAPAAQQQPYVPAEPQQAYAPVDAQQPYAAPQPQAPYVGAEPPQPSYQPAQPQQPYPPAQGQQQKKSKAPLIIGIIVGALVLTGIIVGMIFAFGNSAIQVNDPVETPEVTAPESDTDTSDDTGNTDVTMPTDDEIFGEVGKTYETKWFSFTIESMKTDTKYADYTAAEGTILLIVHISETNVSGSEQPFGTFDWILDAESLEEYVYPLAPLNDKMMPERFTMKDDEIASYDVVFEYPKDLEQPYLVYFEVDEDGSTYGTYKFEVK